MLELTFTNIIEITLSISPVILILLLISKCLAKFYPAKLRYLIWFVIAVRLVIPINISLSDAPVVVTAPMKEYQLPIATLPANPVGTFADGITSTVSMIQTITVLKLASFIWLFGAILFLVFYFASYFVFLKKVKRWRISVYSKEINKIYNTLCAEMNISRSIPLYKCSEIVSPMMVGFFNPTILLPSLEFSAEHLGMVLQHELIHYKRKDLWYKLLLLCTNAVHWFNPVVYIAVKHAICDLEIACDEEVIKNNSIQFRKEYGTVMFHVMCHSLRRQTMLTTHFSPDRKTTKRRFASILDTSKKHKGIAVLSTLIFIVISVGTFVACSPVNEHPVSKPPIVVAPLPLPTTNDKTNSENKSPDTYTDSGKFLSSTNGKAFQATTDKFAKAFFNNDVKTVKSYLIDPKNKYEHFSTKNGLDDVVFLTLKLDPKKIKKDSIAAEYEFQLKGEDTYTYLNLEMKKVKNTWKVDFYGLEK